MEAGEAEAGTGDQRHVGGGEEAKEGCGGGGFGGPALGDGSGEEAAQEGGEWDEEGEDEEEGSTGGGTEGAPAGHISVPQQEGRGPAAQAGKDGEGEGDVEGEGGGGREGGGEELGVVGEEGWLDADETRGPHG